MEQDIGRKLYAAGWSQGVLIDPVAVSIVFAPDDPVSKLARAAAAKPRPDTTISHGVQHGVASGIPKSTERLIIISQACDIVKPLNDEPNIFAMPVFRTDNVRILGPAARNSSRYFLLDGDRGFVVDATMSVVMEKPLLATLKPEVGVATEESRKRLARWLGRRVNRPAIPDDVVAAVVKPMLENLRAMQNQGSLNFETLDRISEVRLKVANENLPFHFDLLFITDDVDTVAIELAIAPLVGEMRGWFRPELAILQNWYARSYGEISVADYLASEQLYIDEYSYEGGTIRGLIAPDPG